jgi:hypothetical protein
MEGEAMLYVEAHNQVKVAGIGVHGFRTLGTPLAALLALIALAVLTPSLAAQSTDTTPPSLVSAEVDSSGETLFLEFDEDLKNLPGFSFGDVLRSDLSITADGEPVGVTGSAAQIVNGNISRDLSIVLADVITRGQTVRSRRRWRAASQWCLHELR